MTRILFITSALNRAGTEAFMMNVFRGLCSDKTAIDFLIFTQEETDYTLEVEASGHKVWRLPDRRHNPIAYIRHLRRFFQQEGRQYQVIHWCGIALSSIAPIYFAWRAYIPVRIIHSHSSYTSGLHNILLHLLFRKAAARISTHHLACSSAAAQWFFGDSEDTIIIKNGIDLKQYSYDTAKRETVRRRERISASTWVIGNAGRFTILKNHRYLIDIFAKLHALHPDSILMLAGKGETMPNIKEQVSRMQLEDCVRFMGERTDIADLMQAMDALVLPSTFEGLPFVLVEAQAAGLYCLVSDNINKDISLTPNIEYLSIDEPAEVWAKQLQKTLPTYKRTKTDELIIRQGYSLTDTLSQLKDIYTQESNQ